MKSFLRKLVLFLLKGMAKRRMKKFKGKVVAVTGSIGKTSTKEAIFSVLNSKLSVKRSLKSMNSEFGVLLTILDIESGFSSTFKWSWFLMKAFYNSLFEDKSEVLLLEFGVDKPGDMSYLTSVVKPDVAVMTNIFPVHLADGQFKDLQDIFNEKSKLVDALKPEGTAILNIDNPFVDSLAGRCKDKKIITFGVDENAMYRASHIKLSTEGVKFELRKVGDKNVYEVVSKVLGEYQVYTLLPAIICGEALGLTLEEAIAAIDRYSLPPGRMGIIPGKKETTILDSSYNSSPESLKQTLKVLHGVANGRRRVAVLGNMNELGERSNDLHAMVGELIPEYADVLVTVGASARIFAEKAREKGMKDSAVFECKTAAEAAETFGKKLEKGDVLLVKGSQNNVRLERFVKALMEHPEDAKELLVRQEKVWQDKL